jgi:hypothetical protein
VRLLLDLGADRTLTSSYGRGHQVTPLNEEAANRSTAAERGAMDRPRRLWDHTAENLLR